MPSQPDDQPTEMAPVDKTEPAPVGIPDAEHYLQHPSDTSYTEHPDYP